MITFKLPPMPVRSSLSTSSAGVHIHQRSQQQIQIHYQVSPPPPEDDLDKVDDTEPSTEPNPNYSCEPQFPPMPVQSMSSVGVHQRRLHYPQVSRTPSEDDLDDDKVADNEPSTAPTSNDPYEPQLQMSMADSNVAAATDMSIKGDPGANDSAGSFHSDHKNDTVVQGQHVNQQHQQQHINSDLEDKLPTLQDIVGHAAAKLRIDELLLPLGLPQEVVDAVFTGIRSTSSSILLYGPPGCGKTQLIQALAGEARAALVSVAPSDILSKFVGESESAVRKIFRKAVEQALRMPSRCAVIFFDEIDALGQSREQMGSGEGEGCSRRVLAELLLQLNRIASRKFFTARDFGGPIGTSVSDQHMEASMVDGSEQEPGASEEFFPVDVPQQPQEPCARIIVAAATNRLDDIDPALVRRFRIKLKVCLPRYKDRKTMLARHIGTVPHVMTAVEFQHLAVQTEGWSGSQLEDLARSAAMRPVDECLQKAAAYRRSVEKQEQCVGDASGQDDQPESSDQAASKFLIRSMRNLRAVNYDDFASAIYAVTGFYPTPVPPVVVPNKKRMRDDHYASATSSDEEDVKQGPARQRY